MYKLFIILNDTCEEYSVTWEITVMSTENQNTNVGTYNIETYICVYL
jgi:hypothetical protein